MATETSGQNSGAGKLVTAAAGGAVAGALLMYVGLWMAGSFSPADQPAANNVAANGNGDTQPGPAANGNGANGERSAAKPVVNDPAVNLAWLPADAEAFARWNVAESWNSPFIQSLSEQTGLVEMVEKLEAGTGQKPQDIKSVTIAGRALDEEQGVTFFNLSSADQMSPLGMVIVVRSNSDIDKEKLTSAERDLTEAVHKEQTYYRDEQGDADDPAALFFPDGKTLVMGSESSVKQAIERGSDVTPRDDLAFLDASNQLIVAIVPQDKAVLSKMLESFPTDSHWADALRKSAAGELKALALNANLGGGVDIEFAANCSTPEVAEEITVAFNKSIAQSRQDTDSQLSELPKEGAAALMSLQDGVKASTNSNSASVKLSISESQVAQIKELDKISQSTLAFLAMRTVTPILAGGPTGPPLDPAELAALESGPAEKFDLPSEAPKEIEVSAIARWSRGRSTDYEGNKIPRDLELWVYVIGQQAAKAISWGDAQFEAVTTDAEEALEPKEEDRYGSRTEKQYQKIRRSKYGSEHPQHGVQAVIRFAHPRKELKSLTEAKGSLKLQVAASKKELIVQRLPSFKGRQVANKELKDLGLVLTLKEAVSEYSDQKQKYLVLTIAGGNADVIANAEAVDANGENLSYVNVYRQGAYGDRKDSFQISAGEKTIPDDLRLKFTLNVGLHEVTVPLDLKDINVPLEPDDLGKPGTPVEGTPEGIKLASKTKWRDGRGFSYDGKPQPPALLVEINMTGPTAKQALAWGFTTVSGATGEGDVPLQMEKERYSQESEATRSLVRILRGEYYDQVHPDDGVRGVIALDHPSKPIASVKNVQGSLKLRIAKETKDAVLKDVKSLVGKEIKHDEFKAAGLDFSLSRVEKTRMRLSLIQGDPNLIGKVTAIDLEGDVLKDVSTSDNRDGQNTYFQIETYEDKFPAGMQLKIQVHQDITILTVPYHFEDLPIPDVAKY